MDGTIQPANGTQLSNGALSNGDISGQSVAQGPVISAGKGIPGELISVADTEAKRRDSTVRPSDPLMGGQGAREVLVPHHWKARLGS